MDKNLKIAINLTRIQFCQIVPIRKKQKLKIHQIKLS